MVARPKTVMVIVVVALAALFAHRSLTSDNARVGSWKNVHPLPDVEIEQSARHPELANTRKAAITDAVSPPADKKPKVASLPSVAETSPNIRPNAPPPATKQAPHRAATDKRENLLANSNHNRTKNPFFNPDRAKDNSAKNRVISLPETQTSSQPQVAGPIASKPATADNSPARTQDAAATSSDSATAQLDSPSVVDLTSEFTPPAMPPVPNLAVLEDEKQPADKLAEPPDPPLLAELRDTAKPGAETNKKQVGEPSKPSAMAVNKSVASATHHQRGLPDVPAVVSQRAREHISYGISLARRGANYAARQEFLQALRLITESRDVHVGTRQHTRQLAAALTALRESDDFVNAETTSQLMLDLQPILATHASQVLDANQIDGITPIQAMQAYGDFAVKQFSDACGRSAVASESLHSLGQLLNQTAAIDPSGRQGDRAKAMVMFQASLQVDPTNYRSANELGVLMARNGRWQQAKRLFIDSLRISQTREAWQNLAKVHQILGEHSLSGLAQKELRSLMANARRTASDDSVREVSAQEFDAGPENVELSGTSSPRTAQAADGETKTNRFINTLKQLF